MAQRGDPDPSEEVLRTPDLFHHATVRRHGSVVVKETGPWAETVRSLLRHLEGVGYAWSPRLAEPPADRSGSEVLAYHYVEGELDPGRLWSLDGAALVGRIVRELHQATASYRQPANAAWKPWFGREIGSSRRVVGHCDVAPWNLVVRDGLPVALIDWEVVGPVDPLVDLAQACWLNARLFSDDVAEIEGLPPLSERARLLRAIVDGYELPVRRRRGFVDLMIEFSVHYTAYQADDAGVTPESTDPAIIWALAWPARSAAWMLRNRRALQSALA